MKEPTYRQTLAHAWSITWHNKALWIFGLFSVLLGQFGFSDIFGQIWSVLDNAAMGGWAIFLPSIKLNWSGDTRSMLGIIWLAGICLALLVALVFLAVTSQGALISYAAEWFKTKKHQKLSKPWGHGLKHFWSILFINILRKVFLVSSLLSFGLVLSYFFNSETLSQGFLSAFSLVIVLFLSLLISIISIYTLCALVIDGKGVMPAIKKSINIFSQHVLVSLEVGVLLMLLNFLLVIVLVVGSFFAFLPAVLIWLAAGATNTLVLAGVGLSVGIFLLLVFTVFVAGFFNAYTTSAWVFLYIKMHKEGINSRVVHFLKHLFN